MALPAGGGPGVPHGPGAPDPLRPSPLLRQLAAPPGAPGASSSVGLEAPVPRSPHHGPPGPPGAASPGRLSLPPGLGPRPPAQRSPGPSPARKRLKLDLCSAALGPTSQKKRKLFEFRTARLRKVTSAYRDNMGELFFLTNGTNVTDNLSQFRKKPTQQFVNFLKAHQAPARVLSEVQTAVLGQHATTPGVSSPAPLRRPPTAYSPRLLPSTVLSPVKVGDQLDVFNSRVAASLARPSAHSPSPALPPVSAPIYSPEQVAERVKQEGWVTRRVAELAKDGLWPERRLPRVAERPRALSAWGLVLEEMKWLSADFRQERLWKVAAARVQSSACRAAVLQRQEEERLRKEQEGSEEHRRGVARRIAAGVQGWWAEVASLHQFEARQRSDLDAARQLAEQAAVVSEGARLGGRGKRKVEEISGGEEGSAEEQGHENGVGVGSDSESTISEQEAWEAAQWLPEEDEGGMLEEEAGVPLARLCREEYPGYEEDVRERWEEEEGEAGDSGLEDSDDEAEEEEDAPVNMDFLHRGPKPGRSEGGPARTDLAALSARAAALAPRPALGTPGPSPSTSPRKAGGLEEHQSAGAEWLAALHAQSLPALLADERGLGRKATVSAFLAALPWGERRGAALLVCPVSSLGAWQHALALHAPTLSLLLYTGTPAHRRRQREEVAMGEPAPNLVITSYRTLFLDAPWFLSRSWAVLVQGEAQNVISAGSAEQLHVLVGLRARDQRILLVSGQQKENPIDLWNTVYLLFPGVMRQRGGQGELEAVEVEGTHEYADTVSRLQAFVASFSLSRSRSKCPVPGGGETKLWLGLGPRQRARYEDYLARPDSQDCLVRGDLQSVYGVIQELRSICTPPLVPPARAPSLPAHCLLPPPAPPRLATLPAYHPLENISLDQVNLVFLSQELSTTVLTSATIRSLAASRALITEVPGARLKAAAVPRHKLAFTLEPVTRAVGGWAVGGLGEGVSLVRAGNGQVYKVGGRAGGAAPPASRPGGEQGLGALHADSVDTIAAVNRWRCDGYPLYGKDLIRSLTVTSSARPARSRFGGQGHVNCLVAEGPPAGCEREGVWRHRTQGLSALLWVGRRAAAELARNVATASASPGGGSDALLASLSRLLTPLARRRGKVVAVTACEASVSHLQHVAGQRGLRYLLVQGSDSLAARLAAVERWRLEPRICLLVLHGITSQTGLDLSSCTAALLLDSEPGRWEPQLPAAAPLHRLATRGTVEEGLARVSTVRRLLADIEACRVEDGRCVRVAKQTLLELLQPSPDNGFTAWSTAVQGKKKEKGSLTDAEAVATLAAVWSEVTGSAGSPGSCPLDLAELETAARDREGPEPGPGPRAVQLRQWLAGLRPAKRRGMRLLRDCWEVRLGLEGETLREGEEVEERKRRWERKRKAEEELEVEDPSQLVTFPKELADRVWRSDDGLEPSVYRAPGLGDELMAGPVTAGYAATTIPEDELPPVHVPRREKKTPPPERETKVICLPPSPSYPDTIPYSPSGISLDIKPKLTRRDEHPVSAPSTAPRSLFDRPRGPAGRPTIARRPGPGTPNYPVATPPGPTLPNKPSPLVRDPESGPEWTIQEDWALHQAVTSLQELPLTLTASSAGHIANWDMVADMVNAVSRCFRSAKQCRARYEGSLVPREEGRLLYDVTPKKIKKLGKLGMTKPEKKTLTPTTKQAMKTGALFKADNNNAFSTMFSGRFEIIKSLANKRTPSTKPLLVNPTMRNPKHAAVLAESGISYDAPLTPVMVAANRADRIAKDKARTAQAQLQTQPAVATPALPTQPVAVSQASARVLTAPVPALSTLGTPASVSLPTAPTQAVVVGISQPLQQHNATVTRPMHQTVTAISMADLLKSTATSTVVSAVVGQPGLTSVQGSRPGQVVITQAAMQGKQAGAQTVQRQLTPQQLAQLKQQAILKKQLADTQLKMRLQQAGGQAGKATTLVGAVAKGGPMVRQGGTVRSMTEAEVKQLMARQQLKIGAGGVVQVPAGTSLTHAQLQQLGIQVAGTSLVSSPSIMTTGTLVKTVQASSTMAGTSTSRPVTIAGASLAGVNLASGQLKAVAGRGAPITGTPQQLQQMKVQRQLQLFQKQTVGGGQRVALQPVAGGKGLPAQLIVQGQAGGKGLPATVTVQQLQQIVKSVAGGGQGQATQQIISHAVLAKPGAPGQTVQARVLPVGAGAGPRAGQQTIQVVAASQGAVRGSSPSVSLDQLGRPQANALANALAAGNHVKIQAPTGASQQQIISQVSAALASHGQNVSVAVRAPISGGQASLQGGLLRSVAAGQGAGQVQVQGAGQQMVNLQLSVAPHPQPAAAAAPANHTASGGQGAAPE